MFTDALRFLKAIHRVSEGLDVQLLMNLASCYRAVGLEAEARDCYETVVAGDPDFTEARVALWNMVKAVSTKPVRHVLQGITPSKSPGPKQKRPRVLAKGGSSKSPVSKPPATTRNSLMQQSHLATADLQGERLETQSLHRRWKELGSQRYSNDSVRQIWLEASNLLLQTFHDSNHVTSRERIRADRLKHRRGIEISTVFHEKTTTRGGQGMLISKRLKGLSFSFSSQG